LSINLEKCPFTGKVNVSRLPFGVIRKAERLDVGVELPLHIFQNVTHHRRIDTRDQSPVSRHKVHKPRELPLDVIKRVVNVGVIKLDVVDDGDLGQVVHELRLLIKIGSVIFVTLDDEKVAVRRAKARSEILHDAADQKA